MKEIDKCVDAHPESSYTFVKGDLADKSTIDDIFTKYNPDIVVNLGAQAGVRYSIANPDAYIQSNLIGFYNILEACRHSYDNGNKGVEHLVYASSSFSAPASLRRAFEPPFSRCAIHRRRGKANRSGTKCADFCPSQARFFRQAPKVPPGLRTSYPETASHPRACRR